MLRSRRFLFIGAALAVVAAALSIGPRTLHVAAGGPPHGQYASSVIYNGQLHVFEWQNNNDVLEHLWWNGSAWQFEYLDGPAGTCHGAVNDGVGEYNSALVYNGQLNDFYFDTSASSLRHAWWNGTRWGCETLDGSGGTAHGAITTDTLGTFNGAVVYGTQLQDFYFDNNAGILRHAWWNGSQWTAQTLDSGQTTNNGLYSAPIVYNGQLHDFYYDQGTGDLRHAWWNGSAWGYEFLDGTGATTPGSTSDNVGSFNSSIIYNGQLQDFYYDRGGFLRHVWWNGAQWTSEELDGDSTDAVGATNDWVGDDTAVTIYNGQLQLFYDDHTNQAWTGPFSLRHAWYNNGWREEALDGPTSSYAGASGDNIGGDTGTVVGQTASALTQTTSLIYNGQIQSFTFDSTVQTLEHEWWNGSRWGFEVLP